jgi:hypothetical protein
MKCRLEHRDECDGEYRDSLRNHYPGGSDYRIALDLAIYNGDGELEKAVRSAMHEATCQLLSSTR